MTPLVKYCKIALNTITMTLAVVFCLFILPKIIVYFMPFVIGGIIAMIANPLVRFLEKRIKIVRKAGSAFVIIMTIAVIFFVIYLVVSMLIEQIVGFAGNLPQVWQSVSDTVADITRSYDRYLSRMPVSIREWLVGIFANVNEDTTSIIQSMGVPMAEAAGNFAKNLPLVIIGIIMAVLSSYFFIDLRIRYM